ncbi:hypothetical protein CR513_35122, partial [Mucuna pruriens]
CFGYHERMKVRLVTLEFTNYALMWWNQVLGDIRRMRREPCVSWAKLKRLNEGEGPLQQASKTILRVDEYARVP